MNYTSGHTPLYEDYVSFEISKLLKEKGFNENINTYRDDFIQHGNIVIPLQECVSKDKVKTPTLQMAMKWLREAHSIIPIILTGDSSQNPLYYWFRIDIFVSGKLEYSIYREGKLEFKTYEEACEASIKYCLENLI